MWEWDGIGFYWGDVMRAYPQAASDRGGRGALGDVYGAKCCCVQGRGAHGTALLGAYARQSGIYVVLQGFVLLLSPCDDPTLAQGSSMGR